MIEMVSDALINGPVWTVLAVVTVTVLAARTARLDRRRPLSEVEAYRATHPHCGHHPGERGR